VKVLGITVSKEQVKFARQDCKGLDITIELRDYRELKEPFDRIVSIGMFEHVGSKNYKTLLWQIVFSRKGIIGGYQHHWYARENHE